MYKIDKDSNRISPLDVQRFSDLNFGERRNLQEWIANEPNVFGEELLVIQKEFAGFDDTNERLDLIQRSVRWLQRRQLAGNHRVDDRKYLPVGVGAQNSSGRHQPATEKVTA